MAKENYDEVIDQKLSELYDVLKALNTLKEKTVAVRDVVSGLAEAGKGRVAEIEEAVGRLGGEIDGRIADVGKSMDAVATRVNAAVESAGKDRIDGIRITAETFSKSLSDLVQSANEGTAKMSKVVAELRGLPFVEEMRSMREEGAKQNAELKAAIESVERTAKSVLPELGTLGAKLGTESQKLAKAVSDASDRLSSAIESVSATLKGVASGIETNRTEASEGFSRQEKQVKDGIAKVTNATDQLAVQIREARESLGKEIGEGAQRTLSALTETGERMAESIGGLKSSLESSLLKVEDAISKEEAATRKRITILGVMIIVAVVVVGVLVAPAGIAAWRAFMK